jgi:hypothetical protein
MVQGRTEYVIWLWHDMAADTFVGYTVFARDEDDTTPVALQPSWVAAEPGQREQGGVQRQRVPAQDHNAFAGLQRRAATANAREGAQSAFIPFAAFGLAVNQQDAMKKMSRAMKQVKLPTKKAEGHFRPIVARRLAASSRYTSPHMGGTPGPSQRPAEHDAVTHWYAAESPSADEDPESLFVPERPTGTCTLVIERPLADCACRRSAICSRDSC